MSMRPVQSLPRHAGSASEPPRRRGGVSVGVHRQGCAVSLILTAADEYAAVELYEHFVMSIEKGRLQLDLK